MRKHTTRIRKLVLPMLLAAFSWCLGSQNTNPGNANGMPAYGEDGSGEKFFEETAGPEFSRPTEQAPSRPLNVSTWRPVQLQSRMIFQQEHPPLHYKALHAGEVWIHGGSFFLQPLVSKNGLLNQPAGTGWR